MTKVVKTKGESELKAVIGTFGEGVFFETSGQGNEIYYLNFTGKLHRVNLKSLEAALDTDDRRVGVYGGEGIKITFGNEN